jgi:hypothetical protein
MYCFLLFLTFLVDFPFTLTMVDPFHNQSFTSGDRSLTGGKGRQGGKIVEAESAGVSGKFIEFFFLQSWFDK